MYLGTFVLYQVIGILLMMSARVVIDRVILYKFSIGKAIVEAGGVEAASCARSCIKTLLVDARVCVVLLLASLARVQR